MVVLGSFIHLVFTLGLEDLILKRDSGESPQKKTGYTDQLFWAPFETMSVLNLFHGSDEVY